MRRILHLDMDAFYASVEQRDDPALRGRPVAVGGRPDRRGVVAAASYEARTFGVRSAMSMARAVRLCPELVVVPPDFARYRSISDRVFDLYRSVTPLVEPLSLDEAYLDVTRNSWNEPLATTVARRLKRWIRDETGLTVSAGAAPQQVPREDRLGLGQARRPDRHPRRAGRRVPAEAAGRGAVGGRPGHREAAAGGGGGPARRRARRRPRPAAARGREPRRLAAPARRGEGRPSRQPEPRREVVGLGAHLSGRPHRRRRRSAARSG